MAERDFNGEPIPITEMGVGQGRTPQEAFLSVRADIFQMVFAASVTTLYDTLKLLEANVSEDQNPPRPN